jgi:hypothetical protein
LQPFFVDYLFHQPFFVSVGYLIRAMSVHYKLVMPRPTIPKFLFTNYLTLDTLKRARKLYQELYFDSLTPYKRMRVNVNSEQEIIRIFNMFNDSLKVNHPFHYHVYSRMTPIYDTFFEQDIYVKSPTKSLIYPFNVVTVFLNSITFFLVLTIGFFAFLFLLFKIKNPFLWLMFLFNGLSILLNEIILMDHENRYILINYGIFVFSLFYAVKLSRYKIYLISLASLLTIFIGFLEISKMY